MATRRDANKAQTAGNNHTTEDSDLEQLAKGGVLSRQRGRDARWNRKGRRKIKDTPSTTTISSTETRNADNTKQTSSKVPPSTARSSGSTLTATSMSPSSSSVLGISPSNVDIRRSNMDKTGSSESSSTEYSIDEGGEDGSSVDEGGEDGSSTSRSSETLASSVSGSSGTISTSTGSDSGITHRNKNASAKATSKTPLKVGGYGRGDATKKNKSERVWAAG